jgi:hypothetical protein
MGTCFLTNGAQYENIKQCLHSLLGVAFDTNREDQNVSLLEQVDEEDNDENDEDVDDEYCLFVEGTKRRKMNNSTLQLDIEIDPASVYVDDKEKGKREEEGEHSMYSTTNKDYEEERETIPGMFAN